MISREGLWISLLYCAVGLGILVVVVAKSTIFSDTPVSFIIGLVIFGSALFAPGTQVGRGKYFGRPIEKSNDIREGAKLRVQRYLDFVSTGQFVLIIGKDQNSRIIQKPDPFGLSEGDEAIFKDGRFSNLH